MVDEVHFGCGKQTASATFAGKAQGVKFGATPPPGQGPYYVGPPGQDVFQRQYASIPNTTPPQAPGPPPILLNGDEGPGIPYVPGRYGQIAATRFQQLEAQSPPAAANSTIQYTPGQFRNPQEANAGIQDAFGYSAVEISRFDGANGQRDGALDFGEIARAFNGNVGIARQWMDFLDRNHDGRVDVVENAGAVLMQDAPDQLMAQTFGSWGAHGSPRLFQWMAANTPPEEQLQILQMSGANPETAAAIANLSFGRPPNDPALLTVKGELLRTAFLQLGWMLNEVSKKPDGVITADDRTALQSWLTTLPFFTKETLGAVIGGSDGSTASAIPGGAPGGGGSGLDLYRRYIQQGQTAPSSVPGGY